MVLKGGKSMRKNIGKIAIYNRVGNKSQLTDTETPKTLDELKEIYIKQSLSNKAAHDVAAKMGSLGASPKHMTMYNESIRLIKEHKSRGN